MSWPQCIHLHLKSLLEAWTLSLEFLLAFLLSTFTRYTRELLDARMNDLSNYCGGSTERFKPKNRKRRLLWRKFNKRPIDTLGRCGIMVPNHQHFNQTAEGRTPFSLRLRKDPFRLVPYFLLPNRAFSPAPAPRQHSCGCFPSHAVIPPSR